MEERLKHVGKQKLCLIKAVILKYGILKSASKYYVEKLVYVVVTKLFNVKAVSIMLRRKDSLLQMFFNLWQAFSDG